MFRSSGFWLAALALCSLAAFWPSYLSRPFAGIDAHTHAHALAMALWCALLVVQPLLVRARRSDLHRRLGVLAWLLGPAVVVSSLLLAQARFRAKDEAAFQAEAGTLYLPVSAALLFALAWGLGMAWRHSPAQHARFMICTALPLFDPVLGRILYFYFPRLPHDLLYQAVTYGATDLVLLGLIARERRLGGGRPGLWVFPAMLALFVPVHLLWFTWAQSPAWRPFAEWFRRLPQP